MTPEQRTLRAQIAAYTRWAHEPNPRAAMQKVRNGMRTKWTAEVLDRNPGLLPAEVEKRVERLRLRHMAKARAAKKRTAAEAEDG